MGILASRQNAAVEEADISSTNHAYKYPPRSGNYFGCHFIMGGERFDTPQPEAYLFGENADLNFLGSRPAPFPYPPPQANELTRTLKSLVNIRKESVRFVKAPDSATKIHGNGTGNKGNSFNLEFTFDADAKCAITIYYFCTEEIGSRGVTYVPRDSSLTSETYHYERGANQQFSQCSHIFNPNLFPEEDLVYHSEKDVLPIAIHCVVEEGNIEDRQSHTTISVVDRHPDGTYSLRALKQKIFIDGLCYLLQEIYGIENKNINRATPDDDTEDNGSECVICMCDTRDTLILPCRHLCLCNSCADSLRYQANNCPICRAPFRALLQIRAIQKSTTLNSGAFHQPCPQDGQNENIPDGYMAVSLIEALNGPLCSSRTVTGNEGDAADEETVQTSEIVNRNNDKNGKQNSPKENSKVKDRLNQITPEFRMSALLSKEDGNVTKELLSKHSPLLSRAPASRDKNPREKGALRPQPVAVKIVNEKNSVPNVTTNENGDNDEDSEAERLSPLLNTTTQMSCGGLTDGMSTSPLHIAGVEDSIDDTDTDLEENSTGQNEKKLQRPALPNVEATTDDSHGVVTTNADDSDYYTPEDPHTTILSPLFTDDKSHKKDITKNHISSPLAKVKGSTTSSLPDSPISGNSATSARSSGDSYSSSSSTRQLLNTANTAAALPSSMAANDDNKNTDITAKIDDNTISGMKKSKIESVVSV